MKRYLLLIVLTIAMVLSMASSTLASPVVPNEEGQFSIYADVSFLSYISLGAGYGIADGWTIGAGYAIFGGVDLYVIGQLGQVILKGDLVTDFDIVLGDLGAVYAFDLGSVTLGVGGGLLFMPYGYYPYAKMIADLKLGESFSIYGQAGYAFGGGAVLGIGCDVSF